MTKIRYPIDALAFVQKGEDVVRAGSAISSEHEVRFDIQVRRDDDESTNKLLSVIIELYFHCC